MVEEIGCLKLQRFFRICVDILIYFGMFLGYRMNLLAHFKVVEDICSKFKDFLRSFRDIWGIFEGYFGIFLRIWMTLLEAVEDICSKFKVSWRSFGILWDFKPFQRDSLSLKNRVSTHRVHPVLNPQKSIQILWDASINYHHHFIISINQLNLDQSWRF